LFVEALGVVVMLEGVMAALAVIALWRIERIAPPQGGFLDVDGVRLHVLDRGGGPPVVLIHGLGGQLGHFAYSLIPRLEGDFHVIAFDRAGSGYSAPAPGGIRAQAAILARAIRILNLGKPLIVGHSLGGTVALAIALDHPDCVGGLALIAPATDSVSRPPALFRSLVIRSPLMRRLYAWTAAAPAALLARPVFFKAAFAPEPAPADFGRAGGGLLAMRPHNIYVTSTELTVALSDDAIETMPQRYASLTVPIGILYGRDDRVLDWRAHGEAMRQRIPSLDFELVDGGHMLPVTQPEVCAAFIRRMAAKVRARANA
jgi:pimeloyl-ACP methyl ester carboxylesterase